MSCFQLQHKELVHWGWFQNGSESTVESNRFLVWLHLDINISDLSLTNIPRTLLENQNCLMAYTGEALLFLNGHKKSPCRLSLQKFKIGCTICHVEHYLHLQGITYFLWLSESQKFSVIQKTDTFYGIWR